MELGCGIFLRSGGYPQKMSSADAIQGAGRIVPAGFRRRLAAAVIDAVGVTVLINLFVLAAYPLSHGRIQSALGIYTERCERVRQLPPGIVVTGFTPNSASHCMGFLLGMPIWNTVTIERQSRYGPVTAAFGITLTIDSDGKSTGNLSLDDLSLLLFLLFRCGLDCASRTTVGRDLCKIRLRTPPDSESGPGDRKAIAVRYAVLAVPFVPLTLTLLYGRMFPAVMLADTATYLYLVAATGAISLIAVVTAAVQIARGREAFYDRFAGTMVCLEPAKPAARA